MDVTVQVIEASELAAAGVQLFIQREDLRHLHISGNKWRKLKYNLKAAKKLRHHTLLTFGGAFSNHIHATAAAGKEFGFNTIGIIRGEEKQSLNPTLAFATQQGMQLHYVSRADYRRKGEPEYIAQLSQILGNFYLLPEGGTNVPGVQGCTEMVKDLPGYDYICCSCGTGGTLAGILAGLQGKSQVLGFSALKGGDFLSSEIDKLTRMYNGYMYQNYKIITDFHFGGYAKATQTLITFINDFKHRFGIPLDPVYTGKMMFGIFSLVKDGFFKKGSTILVFHTGGLQGIDGFNRKYKDKKMHILVN